MTFIAMIAASGFLSVKEKAVTGLRALVKSNIQIALVRVSVNYADAVSIVMLKMVA